MAPSTSTCPFSLLPMPCICTMNSVLMRRAASDSLSPRAEQRESTSSMKMMLGALSRARLNEGRERGAWGGVGV